MGQIHNVIKAVNDGKMRTNLKQVSIITITLFTTKKSLPTSSTRPPAFSISPCVLQIYITFMSRNRKLSSLVGIY